MSFREINMFDVRDMLRRWQAGRSARGIAHQVCVDRKTVGRYLEVAEAVGIGRETVLTDELVAEITRRVQDRPLLPPSEAWEALEARHKQIADWLGGDKPLRLVRVHELLERDEVMVGYSTPTLRPVRRPRSISA